MVWGLRTSAMIEVCLFFALAIAVDIFFRDGHRYWEITPHPFWFIVILISCQYGTNEALVASAVASLALLINNLPTQQFSQDTYDYWFAIAERPLLWFTMAVIVGELRMRHIRERTTLRQDIRDARHRETVIATDYQRLQRFKENLEVRVASQLDTVLTIYQVARAIQKVEPDEVLRGVIEVVNTMMNPKKFSLFLLNGNQLELAIQNGWQEDDTFTETIHASSALFLTVISQEKILCAANADDEHILAQEGILAGPLISQDSGEVVGMLKIERLGFLDFNLTSLQTFKVLCEWIGSTYKNARSFESARSSRMVNDETQLFSLSFFDKQKTILLEMAKRIGFDLSLVMVRLDNADALCQDDLDQIPLAVNRVWKRVLRKTDAACEHSRSGYEFAVILPGTPIADATVVANKISANLAHELTGGAAKAQFSLHTQVLYSETRLRQFLSRDVFLFRHNYLITLADQAGFDLWVMHFELCDTNQFEQDELQRISGSLRRTVETFLRDHEACFARQLSESQFDLVLPALSYDGAEDIGIQLVGAALALKSGLPHPIQTAFTIDASHTLSERSNDVLQAV